MNRERRKKAPIALGFSLSCLVFLARLYPSPAAAGGLDSWLHVAVDGTDTERVRLNLPLALVKSVLPFIEHDNFHNGRIRIDDAELKREELVQILAAIRGAKDGEYVTVEDQDDIVRVAKKGTWMHLDVTERGRPAETVNVRMPMEVLDALVSGEGDELNLVAAIQALSKQGTGDVVTVKSDDCDVRIWVDTESTFKEDDL